MRVLYYTFAPFLDTALPRIAALSQLADVFLILELSPESWYCGLFDTKLDQLSDGVHDGGSILASLFPVGVRRYWEKAVAFNLLVHNEKRSIHPRAWLVSRGFTTAIRDFKPDIIHFEESSLRAALAFQGIHKLPVVQNVHDVVAHPGEENWRARLARRMFHKKVRGYVVHSAHTERQLRERNQLGNRELSTIRMGTLDIFREWITTPLAEEPKTVLFFGRVSPYKGLDVFMRAAEKVSRSASNCRFVIAGRPVRGYTVPRSPQLGNDCRFEFHLEHISNYRMAEFLQSASMVVCPYTEASQSGVVLTAYAFNKPVVATSVGGLPEYVLDEKTGLIVRPNDDGALAQAITRILLDGKLQQRLKRGITESAKRDLNWDKTAERTMDLYRKLQRT